MIHIISIAHQGHAFPVIFPTEKTGDARLHFALLFQAGNFPIDKFCEANEQIRIIEESQMNELEAFRRKWLARGFYPAIKAFETGWEVTLWHHLTAKELYRAPQGRAETLLDAMTAAEADLRGMLNAAKV